MKRPNRTTAVNWKLFSGKDTNRETVAQGIQAARAKGMRVDWLVYPAQYFRSGAALIAYGHDPETGDPLGQYVARPKSE